MKYLELTRGYRAKVDDEDYRRLVRWKWRANLSGGGWVYAVRSVKGPDGRVKNRMLHYEVLGLESPLSGGRVVDHVNHESLDCRKANLRVCTVQQNRWNTRAVRKKSSSRYKGVTWQPAKRPFRGGWQVTITCGGERRYVGFFGREYEAVVAYNRAAARLFGKYGYVNRWEGPTREADRQAEGYRPRREEKARWVWP